MAVKEWNDEIVFVRQVTPGASGKSLEYRLPDLLGFQMKIVVNRAKESSFQLLRVEILIPPLIRINFCRAYWSISQSEETMAISPKPSKKKA